MNPHLPKLIACAALGVCLLPGSGLRASEFLPVTNPGFDAPVNQNFTFGGTNYVVGNPLPQGLYVNTLDATSTSKIHQISNDATLSGSPTATVSGWTALGTLGLGNHDHAGVSNYGSLSGDVANLVTFESSAGFGVNVGFSQTLPGSIQLQPLRTYTLSMDLFKTPGTGLSTNFFADLTVGGVDVGGTLVYTAPTDSTPGSAVVTYSTGASPTAGSLGIIFAASDTTGLIHKILVDNIVVSDNIPEPSTVLLFGVGGLLLWKEARRNRW